MRARAQSPAVIHHNSEVDRFPDFAPGASQPSNGESVEGFSGVGGEGKGSFHAAEHAAAQEIERKLQGLGEDAPVTHIRFAAGNLTTAPVPPEALKLTQFLTVPDCV